MSIAPRWDHFAHGADIGVRGIGPSKSSAFEQAALALSAVITNPAGIRQTHAVEIRCQAESDEILFVDWLNALIYEMATRHVVFGAFSVRFTGSCLNGTAWGEPVDVARHEPAVEVKGATFTALRVAASDSAWTAQCVVDV